MDILHISDNALGLTYPLQAGKPEKMVKQIYNNYVNTNLFLININYKFKDISRSENAGILTLKYLRLYHLNQHCILYSFLSRDQLVAQNPQNLLLFSEGVTFIHMPLELNKIDFEFLKKKKAPEDLSAYFKAEFRLPDNRHFFANWWGMLQLWKVHKAVEKIAGSTVIADIESDFTGSINEMYSYQGLVARYIKKVNDSAIENNLKSLLTKKENDFKDEEGRESKRIENLDKLYVKDYKLEIQLNLLNETLTESRNTVLKKLIDNVTGFTSSIQKKIEKIKVTKGTLKKGIIHDKTYLTLISLIKKEKKTVYEKRRKNNRQITSRINEIAKNKCFSTDGIISPLEVRKKLIEKKPKIVFVDDQAQDGWASIFQRIIYGDINENFTVIQPNKNDKVKDIANEIIENTAEADLLILDLRLKGEKGSINDINKISGFNVLSLLKKAPINCPILITTASNKIWSYKETLNFGANAYWIKEGLDNNINIDYTIENYLRFIDLVYTLIYSEEFNFLYKVFMKNINQIIKPDTKLWWESKFWGSDNQFTIESNGIVKKYTKSKITEKETVKNLLNVSFTVFETYLNQKIQNKNNTTLDNSFSSVIIIQCFRVLEQIHNFDDINNKVSISKKIKLQIGTEIYTKYKTIFKIRNLAVHNFNSDFKTIQKFSELFFKYLTVLTIDSYVDLPPPKLALSPPVSGGTYTSKICLRRPTGKKYHLSNPGLSLRGVLDYILLDITENRLDPEELKIDTKIEFELRIENEGCENENYFAENAGIIVDNLNL